MIMMTLSQVLASKQSKSSFIDDVEIRVHTSPASKDVTVRVIPKVAVSVEKNYQKTISGFLAFQYCLACV